MNISTQFQIESLNRIIDECDDIEEIKKHTKSLIKLYFMQRDIAKQLLLQPPISFSLND